MRNRLMDSVLGFFGVTLKQFLINMFVITWVALDFVFSLFWYSAFEFFMSIIIMLIVMTIAIDIYDGDGDDEVAFIFTVFLKIVTIFSISFVMVNTKPIITKTELSNPRFIADNNILYGEDGKIINTSESLYYKLQVKKCKIEIVNEKKEFSFMNTESETIRCVE